VNHSPLNGHSTGAAPPSIARETSAVEAPVQHADASAIRALSPDARRQPVSPRAASTEQVRSAVARARAAQYEWNLSPLARRIAALESAAHDMLRRRSEVIELAHREMGKVVTEGLLNEALGPVQTVKEWSRIVARATARRHVWTKLPRKSAYVDLVARGVVGVIAPWNFPVSSLYRSTFPALLTGNGVVVKPSEFTPETSGWFVERLASALPEGLIHVVQGGARVGEALIDAGIDACVFTGSPKSGRVVQVHCAERGVACSIEMGGKDAAIVLSDCDLERTVAGVTHWALANVGQACGAIEIAYVDDRIADSFVGALRSAWARLRVGPDRLADIGPLANRQQFDVVVEHVEDARAKGAVVVCGGAPTGEGLFFAPTLLDHCNERMKVVESETFGPVLAIVRVSGAAEAVRRVNASRYGLGASIWTRDIARAKRLAERLEVGVVTVNNHALSGAMPALPWSGTRDTGLGIANSAHALATFVRPRATVVDAAKAPDLFWMPYDEALLKLGEIVASLQTGRLAQAWRLPLLLRQRIRTVRRFFENQ